MIKSLKTMMLSSLLISTSVFAKVERPPQYVLLAFDGSKSLEMWNDTMAFTRELEEEEGIEAKFTYFISAVYFLTWENRRKYDAPKHKKGASAIGFAKTNESIASRVNYLNQAIDEGHEIASHAVGHFNGSDWSKRHWMSEFKQFEDFIFNVVENNGLEGVELLLRKDQVKGFRAPQLGVSNGLWKTLKEFNFDYDTSETSRPEKWPVVGSSSGAWNFPLASIPVVGTSKMTLSMDYNFYVTQSGGKRTLFPWNLPIYKNQMFKSYMKYFNDNYYGNRAPIHIGHHFSLWNGGIYWKALKEFTREVCGLPEVECVTYETLVKKLNDAKSKGIYEDYRRGNFDRYTDSKKSLRAHYQVLDIQADLLVDKNLIKANVSGKDGKNSSSLRKVWVVNNEVVEAGDVIRLQGENLPEKFVVKLSLRNADDLELQSVTQVVKNVNGQFELVPGTLEEQILKGEMIGAHVEGYDTEAAFLEQK